MKLFLCLNCKAGRSENSHMTVTVIYKWFWKALKTFVWVFMEHIVGVVEITIRTLLQQVQS